MLRKEQIEEWVEQYGDELYRYIFMRVQDEALAKDLVQETFLAAVKSRSQFKAGSNPLAWLYTIIKNKMIDHYRARQRKPTQSLSDSSHTHTDALFFDQKGGWKYKPGSRFFSVDMGQAERDEFWEIFEFCQRELSEKQRLAFVLKYLEGWDSNEICKELDITSSNYWVLIHRAKLKLQKCLENNWLNV